MLGTTFNNRDLGLQWVTVKMQIYKFYFEKIDMFNIIANLILGLIT